VRQYIFAIALVVVSLLVRAPVWGILGESAPYLTFFPALSLAAYFGGFGPGLLATALSLLAALLLIMGPFGTARTVTADAASLLLFALTGTFISYICQQFRQAREEVHDQRLLTEQTLASIGDGVIATDTGARITFVNPAAERTLGWTAQDLESRPIHEVFRMTDEASGSPVMNPVDRVLKEGMAVKVEHDVVLETKDGRKLPVDHNGAPIRDEHGRVKGAVLVFRDTSELRLSERRLASTLESIQEAVFSLDENWRITYANPAALSLFEMPGHQVIGADHWELFPHMSGTELERNYRMAAAEKKTVHFEFRSPRVRKWFDIRVYPADRGLTIYFHDVTERRRTDAKIRDHEQRLSRLAESNVIGIMFGDIHGNIRYVNDEICRILDCSRQDLLAGRVRPADVTPEEYKEADRRALAEAQARGNCTPYEKEYLRPDGSRVPVFLGYVLLGEERVESVAFIVDLTERKRAVEELRHFAYGASHDLKQPLRMISSYSKLLARKYSGKLDADADEYLRYILHAADQMRALVDSLIEYSRAGEVTAQPESRADPSSALQSALMNLGALIQETGATITAGPMPVVCVEELPLSRIFQNLVGNAIHYRGEEPPQIYISAETGDGDCTFSVEDNGLGIAIEDQSRLFGLFQRLHGRERAGSGLGLATCKRIVERYGGHIWAESKGLGQGSTFRFTLPIAPS
jgi:PAS domain S-box-containing protein